MGLIYSIQWEWVEDWEISLEDSLGMRIALKEEAWKAENEPKSEE